MSTVELTKDNFDQMVSGNDTVVVDFWAPWCGPCRSFAPVFEATSEKYPGVVFGKVNTEEEQELAGYFEIRSIPTLMVFREKVLLVSQAGALPGAALESMLNKVQGLDMAQVHRDVAAQEAAQTSEPA
ncbi:MAG: thioredoxin [Burkholderiales bacterium]